MAPPGVGLAPPRANNGWVRFQPARSAKVGQISAGVDTPELNAIEKVWQYLRDRYLSGRLFNGTRAIVDACCEAWNKLIAETGRIQSLTDFEWARQVSR